MSFIILHEEAAPATPGDGKVALYPKTDGCYYTKDDAGTETQLGSSAGGGPDDAQYIVAVHNSSLANDKTLTGVAPITVSTSGSLANVGAVYTDPIGITSGSLALKIDATLRLTSGSLGVAPSSSTTGVQSYPSQGRLTTSSTLAVNIADALAQTTIYFLPYNGNQFSVYDTSGSTWSPLTIPAAGKSIKLTDAQTGTTVSGNMIISGLADTSQLIVGMEITGTGVGFGSTIATIDSPTQVTGTVNSTASASVTVTFKVPTAKELDIFGTTSASALKLSMVQWTSASARATAIVEQDGIEVMSGDASKRYIGTVHTFAAGQTEISYGATAASGGSAPKCGVWNRYNRIKASFRSKESDNTWAYTSTWRAKNNSVGNSFRFIIGRVSNIIAFESGLYYNTGSASVNGYVGFGLDRTNAYDGFPGLGCSSTISALTNMITARYGGLVAEGFHTLSEIEYGGAGGVFCGDAGVNSIDQSGAVYDHEY